MSRYQAFIFDLNGTIIHDMPYHVKVWQDIVNELGAGLSLEETQAQCYGKNQDLLERVFPGRFNDEEKDRIGMQKEERYQQWYRPDMKLINGLDSFLQKAAAAHIPMAIGSAAIMFNINFILDGTHTHAYFKSIVSADDVVNSKPDPETFLKNARELGIAPEKCLVFEDAPKGIEAAQRAGMDAVCITTMHPAADFAAYDNIVAFIDDYTSPALNRFSK
ncbi:HAD family hydrolase [Terrimonas rubra]|uniref:HAD family hydrolase n=1 Tax=Terrimonas rubra TaxID=1035890 RepID=A0ABW6A5S6_9BACT